MFKNYELAAAGTSYSKEFAGVLKKYMDTFPITASSLARYYKIEAGNFSRCYKECLSGFPQWEQSIHADKWLLLEKNMGTDLSIDETQIGDDVRTILTNKDGHGRKGSMIAIVKGTNADDIVKVLLQLPEDKRNAVKEVTMDFSDSMYSIVQASFPNATIVIDCFHIIKRCRDSIEELRLKIKRKEPAKRRERRPHTNASSVSGPSAVQNTEPVIQRTTMARSVGASLCGSMPSMCQRGCPTATHAGPADKRQKASCPVRRQVEHKPESKGTPAVQLFPDLQKAYGLVQSLRSIFGTDKKKKDRHEITREEASVKLDEWCQKVTDCKLREVKAARDCILDKREEVLNYFIHRSTNASAESINAKMKGFRSEIHGIQDLPFFLFRCTRIFG